MGKKPRVGVILTGGGARGAYQAGALLAVSVITRELGIAHPFPILSGVSAGAINAAYLAAHADRPIESVRSLAALWENLTSDQIYKTGPIALSKIGLRWLVELLSGGSVVKKAHSLLDTEPLRQLLEREIPFEKIGTNLAQEHIESLAITALNYANGVNYNFYQTKRPVEPWEKIRRIAQKGTITVDHVMASSAIPIFFPPAKVNNNYFGDGSLRNYAPMSPPIHLGAERLLVIAVRRPKVDEAEEEVKAPTIGRITSVLLNAVMLDAVDIDCERLSRINNTLNYIRSDAKVPLRQIEVCMLHPSEDIAEIALEEAEQMPRTLRYLLRGLGTPKEDAGLLSYLLFEPGYTRRLSALGYRDTLKRKDEIVRFYQGGME